MAMDDGLTLEIVRRLEVDLQFDEFVEASRTERIAEIRAASVRAGRLLGCRIDLTESVLDDETGTRVRVTVRKLTVSGEMPRLRERSIMLIKEALRNVRRQSRNN